MEKRVTKVELIDADEEVYDIEVEQDHCFLVSGVVAHNSDVCRSRAWKVWDAEKKPVGHKLLFSQPPLHSFCRSRLILTFLDDPPARQLTFNEFVGQMSRSQRVKLFGESNVKLWEKGLLTDAQMIRQQGRPLTLEELRKRVESKSDQTEFLL